jgi:protein-export membrane protein SecD
LILAQEEKVSPVLWEQALSWAIIAAWVWLALIYVFMIMMYGFRQWSVAILTLLSFIVVLLWITKLFRYSFSLSGIAAILLSLGMGVDANVLIYERIREERKSWLSRFEAIEEWYKKSYSAIRDGNVTTLMIAILLFFIGTNVFKGFGTMMMVNILLTLWVIVPLTRWLLHTFYGKE